MLTEGGDKVPAHDKARAEQLISDARQAVKDEADADRCQTLLSDLQQMGSALAQYANPQGGPGGETPGAAPDEGAGAGVGGGSAANDDVIDAEFKSN